MNGVKMMVLACLGCLLGMATVAAGNDYQSVKVTKLLTATTATNGQKLAYLATDRPEVTALVVEIPPGGETGWHLHQVPVYAYVLSGTIAVTMKDGTSYSFREGEAIFEVLNTPHNGRNTGKEPVKLVVFYTGEQGKPNVTRVERPAPEALP